VDADYRRYRRTPGMAYLPATGYPGWLGSLMLIPVVNLIFLYFLAFADWPANKVGDRQD
tara:strand:+ start:10879 stop:11055 length:177 start_codon:yes stop_codon:yes gene_type:complete